jgi:hexosaminidase
MLTCLLLLLLTFNCRSEPAVWPQPASLEIFGTTRSLDSATFIFSANVSSPLLQRALGRYSALVFVRVAPKWWPPQPPPTTTLAALRVAVGSVSEALTLETDESYVLNVPASGDATLTAATVFGALRGLETMSQMVGFIDGNFIVNAFACTDAPRFPWRGALVDTARHFLPMPALLAFIDALAYAKMNVFHMHLTDDSSFPYVSVAFPNLARTGAYDAANTFAAHTYAPADIAALIAYGHDRGVRVVAEFDTPGHSGSWAGQPNLLTPCYNASGVPDGSFGPINPTLDTTWSFLESFFSEVASVFQDEYIHIGGDEVSFDCWASNPNVTAWMSANGMAGDFPALESYYVQRVLQLIQSLNKTPVGWQEIFDNNLTLTNRTVVHVWKNPFVDGQAELARVTAAGFFALLSSGWYINYEAYVNEGQWETYYTQDPTNFTGTDAQKALIVGGEFALWAEFIDATNLISRGWPSGAAVAERLWSPSSVTSLPDANVRLTGHTCRLLARGVGAEPPSGPNWCPQEWAAPYTPPFSAEIDLKTFR